MKLFTRFACGGAFGLAAALGATVASADDAPASFHPPIGSRWIIQRDLTEEDNANGVVSRSTMKITSELTIEAKVADGFRLSYARRAFSYEPAPDDSTAESVRVGLTALQGIVYHVVTDSAGKPLSVDNFDELLAARGKMIDAISAGVSPAMKAVVEQTFASVLGGDAQTAAQKALDELPALSIGQNAGATIDEARATLKARSEAVGDFPGTATVTVDSFDPAAGNSRFKVLRIGDVDAMRAMLNGIAERAGASDPDGAAELIDNVKRMTLSQVDDEDYDVAEGMTRQIRSVSTTTRILGGDTLIMTDRMLVTVTPAD